MSKQRISKKSSKLRDLMNKISSAIAAESNWPKHPPTQADIEDCAASLTDSIDQVEAAQAKLDVLRKKLHADNARAFQYAQRIDYITTALYGPHAEEKRKFGIPPMEKRSKKPDTSETV